MKLIESIGNYPYLWGAIESALIAELKAGQYDLIIELGQKELQSIHEMVLSILVLYGRSYAQEGTSLLERLYVDRRLKVKKTAVQAAGMLGIEPILVEAGQSPEPDIRAAAARATYHLWQEIPEAGWRVLEKWASSVRGKWNLPRLRCVESCLGLSILILTDRRNVNYQDKRIWQPLQQIWRGILEDLLFVERGEAERLGFRSLVRDFILSAIIKFGLTIVEGRATVTPRYYASPIPDAAAFFRLPQSKRDIFQRLLEHLKANTPIRDIEKELFQAVEDDDALTIFLTQIILLLGSPFTEDQGLTLVKQLFDTALENRRPGLAASQLVFNASRILRRRDKPISDEAFQLYQQMQEDYLKKAKGTYYTTTTNTPREAAYIDAFTELEWKKYHRPEPVLLSRSFEEARRENDKDLIRNLIHELGALASIAGPSQIALNGSKVLLHYNDPDVKEWYVHTLSWIRLYDQDAVEDFLEEHDVSHDFRRLVRTREVHEDMWGDILVSRVGDLTAKLLFVPRIREEAIWILEKALECKNLEQWLKLILKRLINFVYGEPLLQLEQT